MKVQLQRPIGPMRLNMTQFGKDSAMIGWQLALKARYVRSCVLT